MTASPLKGKGASAALIDDWDLELDAKRPPTADHKPRQTGKQPKLVHKMIFSMPAGTPPEKVLAAVKDFAREEFGAKHRYAMVLHTDEPHPHVHMVVKAMGYDGTRLNIRKATLREWRREFARHLREHGVAANATERAVRGVTKPQKQDGIYRAERRRDSTHWRQRTEAVAREMTPDGEIRPEPGKARVALRPGFTSYAAGTRVADDLVRQGQAGACPGGETICDSNCQRSEPSANGSAIGCSSRRREASARSSPIDGSRTPWLPGRPSGRSSSKRRSRRGSANWSVRGNSISSGHESAHVIIAMTGRDRIHPALQTSPVYPWTKTA